VSASERWLLRLTPFAAMLAVALGLRLGAPSAVRAAVVYAAPVAAAGTGLAWQIVALEGDNGARAAIAGTDLDVTARSGGSVARWRGITNDEGVAEAQLALDVVAGAGVELEVRSGASGAAVLARGLADMVAPPARPGASPWLPFAARSGPVVLDVAVLGQRAAPGWVASVWVRATDPSGGARLAGVIVEAEGDTSVASARALTPTDSNGWAELDLTPVGLAVALRLHASAPGGRSGDWTGGLFMSPGAPQIETRARWGPDESPEVAVVPPSTQTTGYVEIDDAQGRAWATTFDVVGRAASGGSLPRIDVHAPRLAPGLYWAVASNDAASATTLGPGTMARPFFVAAGDDAALAFGTDRDECAPPADARETSRRLASCLAVSTVSAVSRWLALDGFVTARARASENRSRGLGVALGAVASAALIEALLVLRAAAASRARLRAALTAGDGPSAISSALGIAIGLLVALLGFLLLAAFLVRAA